MAVNNSEKSKKELRELRKAEKFFNKDSKQAKKDRKVKVIVLTLITVLIAGFSVFGIYKLSDEHRKNNNSAEEALKYKGEQKEPTKINDDGSYHIGKDGEMLENDKPVDNTTRIDMFFDPQCPACGMVERQVGDRMDELVNDGEADLYLYPVAFLDNTSSDRYSTRSLNAMITVAENDPDKFYDYYRAIFAPDFQPGEASAYVSVSDDKLANLARQVGVKEDVAESITEKHYIDWVIEHSNKQTERKDFFKDGFSTPAVFLNTEYKNGEAENYTRVNFTQDMLSSFNNAFDNAK